MSYDKATSPDHATECTRFTDIFGRLKRETPYNIERCNLLLCRIDEDEREYDIHVYHDCTQTLQVQLIIVTVTATCRHPIFFYEPFKLQRQLGL